jgi:hypothetical protein
MMIRFVSNAKLFTTAIALGSFRSGFFSAILSICLLLYERQLDNEVRETGRFLGTLNAIQILGENVFESTRPLRVPTKVIIASPTPIYAIVAIILKSIDVKRPDQI